MEHLQAERLLIIYQAHSPHRLSAPWAGKKCSILSNDDKTIFLLNLFCMYMCEWQVNFILKKTNLNYF